jgi:hypothetical protein
MQRDDEDEYTEEVVSKHEYYNSGLNGWKRAVLDYLPHGSSMAFRMQVEEFLDSIKGVS